jgi:transcriptional regulator with XRE-family HTH domain
MERMNTKDLNRWIGANIYKARSTRRLSQESLAEAVDVSRVFISQLENGNQSAKIDTYYRIACALDISLCELFRRNDETESMDDIFSLLHDCSSDEIRACIEILRVVKYQYTLLQTRPQ